MAVTQLYSGTKAVSTEWSLTANAAGPVADTNAGAYQTVLDINDMVTGDELQIRIYEKARSGDPQRVVLQSNLVGPQSPPTWISPTFMLMWGWDVTLVAVAGGTITVLWSIRKA